VERNGQEGASIDEAKPFRVTPGEFNYAPVVAEAMYNAEHYSASGQMRMRVAK
jgi:hypothetical protein